MITTLLLALFTQGDPEWEHWGSFGAGTTVVRKLTEQQGSLEPAERTQTLTITKWDGEIVDIELSGDPPEKRRYLKPVRLPEKPMADEELTVGGKAYRCTVKLESYYAGKLRWTVQRAVCARSPVPGGVMRAIHEFQSDSFSRKEAFEIASIREGVELTVDGTKHACVMYEEDVRRVGVHEPRRRTMWYAKDADVPGGIVRTKETYALGDFLWSWTTTSTPGEKAKVGDREVAGWKRVTVLEKTRPLVKGWKAREETVEKLSKEVPGWLVTLERAVTGDGGEARAAEATVSFEAKKN